MRTNALYLTSIISGFCMMALEIFGGRYLYPFFGSGVDVWAAIISVFILSLSIGYWLGGRIADKADTNRALGTVILAAAVFYLLIPTYARPFAGALPPSVHEARWGSLLASMVLFLPPSLLLGCVSPMLVKLVFLSGSQVGRTTGTLYAIGSVGNVIGILATNFILLASLPLNTISWGMGVALALLGLIHLFIPIEARASTRNVNPTGPSQASANPDPQPGVA